MEQGNCSDLGPLRAACSVLQCSQLPRTAARPGHCGPRCQARGPSLKQEHFTVYREFHIHDPMVVDEVSFPITFRKTKQWLRSPF